MKIDRINWLLLIIYSLLAVLTVFSVIPSNDFSLWTFFNSDTLYLPSIYKDIFIDGNSLKGWYFNPAPNFFPDMLLYFLISALTPDFIYASFVFALVQYVIIILLVIWIYKQALPGEYLAYAGIGLLFLSFFLWEPVVRGDLLFAFGLVNNSYHTGAFVMALLGLALTLSYLRTPKPKWLILLGLTVFFAVFSDTLFIITFSIPLLTLLVLPGIVRPFKRVVFLELTNLAAVILSLVISNQVRAAKYVYFPQPPKLVDFKAVPSSWDILSRQMNAYFHEGWVKQTVLLLCILIALYWIARALLLLFKRKSLPAELAVVTVFIPVFIQVVFWAPVLAGMYAGWDSIRYNTYAFYLTLISAGFIFYALVRRKPAWERSLKLTLTGFLMAGILFFVVHFRPGGLRQYFTYYPERVKCIDEMAAKNGLKTGMANYWHAKFITMFSKTGLRVYAGHEDIVPYYHVVNSNWYSMRKSVFNFVILNDYEHPNAFRKRIGNNYEFLNDSCLKVVKTCEFRFLPFPSVESYFLKK